MHETRDDQLKVLDEILASLGPAPLGIFSVGDASEADRFRDQLGEVFKRAGWSVDIRAAVAAMQVEGVALRYYTGHSGRQPPTPSSEDTLRLKATLERAGLTVHIRRIPGNETDFHWILAVGRKPRS